MGLQEVPVRPVPPTQLAALIGSGRAARFEAGAEAMRTLLSGRTVLNVNSTAAGGGVAELLHTLLATVQGFGIDARWVVIEGSPDFFALTKRIHNHLYGMEGDGGPLGPGERRLYEATLRPNATELVRLARPDDVVLLHDPQTAGLASSLQDAGVSVVWRCHVGLDVPNEHSELAWDFLRPYIAEIPAFVFSRAQFAPPWIPRDRLFVIPPSIDPFSAKNAEMGAAVARDTLCDAGVLDGGAVRKRSSTRISHPVDLLGTGPPPRPDEPIVCQVSRWDTLKDMRGVMTAFAEHLPEMGATHLVLAGPSVHGVADDPEAAEVLEDCLATWEHLADDARRRIHLVSLPMTDAKENATVVNALQRHVSIVVQKSLAEGFGLTVAEAMWKARPVVASAVGGIVDQVVSGETGWLLTDPNDLDGFAALVGRLIADPTEADRMGRNGRVRASEHFLGDRHLEQWAELLTTQIS